MADGSFLPDDWRGEHLIRIPRRPPLPAPAKPAAPTPMSIAPSKIRALAASGETMTNSARILGCSRTTLSRAAHLNGIEFKPRNCRRPWAPAQEVRANG